MCNKVRCALMQHVDKLGGIVEIDETFMGGKDKNRHVDKRGTIDKVPVVGAVRRKGNVICRVVENVSRATLEKFVNEAVSTRVSLLCSDEWPGYNRLRYRFNHGTVDHSKGQHVIGAVHTNTIEGFWSIIKRGVVGTFHKVSKKYLPFFAAEFQFHYNNRDNADIFGAAIKGC